MKETSPAQPFGGYFKYAVGEVLLVVIGILIALSINNWNEELKNKKRLDDYKQILKSELKADLHTLTLLKEKNDSLRKIIKVYLDEYNSPNPDTELLSSMNIVNSIRVNTFTKTSFTLDEVTNNGSIALFSEEIKQAIIDLKYTQELYGFYERESTLRVVRAIDKRVGFIDFLHEQGLSQKEHKNVAKWQQNLDSEQYLHQNNVIAMAIEYWDYQDGTVHLRIRAKTERLLKLLQN